MYYGYTVPELAIFISAAAVIIWAFWRIFTGDKHASKFFFWFLIFATVFSLWAWRTGNAVELYQKIKTAIGTPGFDV
jgi:hypothetical protein